MKKISFLLAVFLFTFNVTRAGAASFTITTRGYLGSNTLEYSIDVSGGSTSYHRVSFLIESEYRVETLTIKNINIVYTNGASTMGHSVTDTNEFELEYAETKAPTYALKSASGTFSVSSYNFGSYSKAIAY